MVSISARLNLDINMTLNLPNLLVTPILIVLDLKRSKTIYSS